MKKWIAVLLLSICLFCILNHYRYHFVPISVSELHSYMYGKTLSLKGYLVRGDSASVYYILRDSFFYTLEIETRKVPNNIGLELINKPVILLGMYIQGKCPLLVCEHITLDKKYPGETTELELCFREGWKIKNEIFEYNKQHPEKQFGKKSASIKDFEIFSGCKLSDRCPCTADGRYSFWDIGKTPQGIYEPRMLCSVHGIVGLPEAVTRERLKGGDTGTSCSSLDMH
ncbi:MAG: hypothetical protein PHQ23_01435 [Candidatus Wallbacteria bacterium]|nr:hypothetical protein [Candidatus Wallbacteria bacterium]